MKAKAVVALLMTGMLLTMGGCGKKSVDSYTYNTMTIGKNDTIYDVSVEDFSGGQYNMQDLEQFINGEIDAYNNENGEHITLDALNTENMLAKVQIAYDTIEDYNRFNRTDYSLRTFAESGLSGNLYAVGDGTEVPVTEISDKGYKVLSVTSAMNLEFDGKPLYYNSNVTVNDGTYTANGEGPAVVVYK